MCTACTSGPSEGQKRALGSLELEMWSSCELPGGHWEQSPSLLPEQMLLSIEPFPPPPSKEGTAYGAAWVSIDDEQIQGNFI